MKCPKCGYLGFETSDRCRNCGYDFSLAVDVGPADELPLNATGGAGAPLADFDLASLDTEARLPADDHLRLDLDRVIGDDHPERGDSTSAHAAPVPSARSTRDGEDGAGVDETHGAAIDAPRRAIRRGRPAHHAPSRRVAKDPIPHAPLASDETDPLPLFATDDDVPLINTPRPLRPPLAVRRTTPEIPRVRPRAVAPLKGDGDAAATQEETSAAPAMAPDAVTLDQGAQLAAAGARLAAALFDGTLLGGINLVVVYLTLALAGLTWAEMAVLPKTPLLGFLALLDIGYLIVFVAAGGQTIGKMLAGIRVLGDDGSRVDVPRAVLRALGCGVSLLTAGLGYLPALFSTDRRALHDRLAGTRVVRAR